MKHTHVLVALAAFSISAYAFAANGCGYPDDPNWDPQTGTCQGSIAPSCQDTNLIDQGGCEGSGNTSACSDTKTYVVKKIYAPKYSGRCSSTNPCVDATPNTGQTQIEVHTGSDSGRPCIQAEVPIDPDPGVGVPN